MCTLNYIYFKSNDIFLMPINSVSLYLVDYCFWEENQAAIYQNEINLQLH